MTRPLLDEAHVHPAIREKMASNHADIVREVQNAISRNAVVVIGMAQNPFPRQACRALEAAGVPHLYLQYGSYLSQWRRRLALKIWTGWSTFPMVFVNGILVGGASDLERLIKSGDLNRMLSGSQSA
jgi:glutaredoxin-related protein